MHSKGFRSWLICVPGHQNHEMAQNMQQNHKNLKYKKITGVHTKMFEAGNKFPRLEVSMAKVSVLLH